MKYGLLKYEENKRFFNVGDNIQSLAAKQFLPRVDKYLSREKLADYKGEKVKLIMNKVSLVQLVNDMSNNKMSFDEAWRNNEP